MKKIFILITGLIFISFYNSANATFVAGNFTINTNFIDTGGNISSSRIADDVVENSLLSDVAGFDPDIYLQNIVRVAADAWEAVLPVNQTFDLNFGWDDTGGSLGVGGGFIVSGTRNSGYLAMNSDLLTNVGRQFYLDSTPTDNVEFSETRTWTSKLTGDPTNSDWVVGIMDTETGGGRETIVNLQDPNGIAYDGVTLWNDLYSTAVHEIGHALGFTSGMIGNVDGDISGHLIVSDWQYEGTELDLYHNGTTYKGHLNGTNTNNPFTPTGDLGTDVFDLSLMRQSGGYDGRRRHISDVDILAIGIMREYSHIRLNDGTILPLPEPSSIVFLVMGSLMIFFKRVRKK